MADNKNIIETIIEFITDKSSLEKAKRGYDEIEEKAKNSDKEIKNQIRSVRDLGKEFTKFGKRGADSVKNIGTEFKKLNDLDDDLRKRLDDRDKQFNQLSQDVGLAGDVQSNLGSIQGLLGSAGAGGASQAIGVAGEVAVLAEELPRLKESLTGLPDTLRASVNALGAKNVGAIGAIGALTLAIIALQNEASKRTAQFKEELTVGKNARELARELSRGELEERKAEAQERLDNTRSELEQTKQAYGDFNQAVVDEFGVLGAGIAKVNSALGTNNTEFRSLEETISELEKETQTAESEVNALNLAIQNTASESNEATARINDERLINSAQEVADLRRFEADALEQSFETNQRRLDGLTSESDILLKQIDAIKKNNDGSEEAQQAIESLTSEYVTAQKQIAILENSVLGVTFAIAEEEKATQLREDAIKRSADAEREREQVLGRVNQLTEQANSLIERFAERQSDFTRKQAQELEDFNISRVQAQEDLNREIADIQASGNDRVRDLNQSLSDLQDEYFQEQIDSQRAYADELEQIDARRNLERIQRERQGANELADIANENDVLAFLRAKREQDRERQREAENANLEERERAQEFNRERQQQEQAFQQRQRLIQRQIREEEQAIQKRIADAQSAFEIESQRQQQAFDLAKQRAQEELNLERQKTQQQLALIQQKAQQEINAIAGTTSQVRVLQNAVDALSRTVSNFNRGASSASSASRSNNGLFGSTALGQKSYEQRARNLQKAVVLQRQNSGRTALSDLNRLGVAFANGGIADRPTLGLVGERPGFSEAIIPFRPSEGIRPALQRAGMGGAGNIMNLTINATVGDNASIPQVKQMLTQAVEEAKLTIVRGVADGMVKARFNSG